MALQAVVDHVVTFVREHESWAGPVAFLVAFGESFCFFSLLLPGTAILAGIAALLAASGISAAILTPAIIAAGLGGSLGYAVSYWIGLYFKDSIHKIWPFSKRPYLIANGQEFFDKYGAFGVFLGHFFGPVRAVIPVVAGMFGMRQLPFQIANIASAFIWATGIIGPAFYLVTFKTEITAFIVVHEFAVAAVLSLLAFLVAIPRALVFGPALLLYMGLGAVLILTRGDFLLLWLAGAAGAFLGDLFAYAMKSRTPPPTFMTTYPADHDAARRMIEKRGAASLILSKFQGAGRGLVPFELGGVPHPGGWFIVSALSALIWSAVYLLPGVIAGVLAL